ncbi:hypothetical protein Tco_1180230 [Tanacetum coccineum]
MDKPFPPPPLNFPSCKIAKLAIPQFPKLCSLTESMVGINSKKHKSSSMAKKTVLDSLTEETHFARLKI